MTDTLASWHPFIVHFAVAFTITSALLDAADFLLRRTRFAETSFLLAMLALPFLLAAVLTGNLAAAGSFEPAQRVLLDQHETYANIAVWVFSAAAVWRLFLHLKKRFHGRAAVAYVFIITLAAASVFLTARRGGAIRHTAATGAIHGTPSSHPPAVTGDDIPRASCAVRWAAIVIADSPLAQYSSPIIPERKTREV